MSEPVDLMPLSALAPGTGRCVRVQGRDVALFRVGDAVFALDDSCPHAGSSLGSGQLQGGVVRCRAHGLRFDLSTGCMPGNPGLRVATHTVTIVDDRILLRLSS